MLVGATLLGPVPGAACEPLIRAEVEYPGEDLDAVLAVGLDQPVAAALQEQHGGGEGLAAEAEQLADALLQAARSGRLGGVHPLSVRPAPLHPTLPVHLRCALAWPRPDVDRPSDAVLVLTV